jgi:hypothetical protein
MPQFEIRSSTTTTVYGFDKPSGVYLSIFDKRLEISQEASEEVNEISAS